MLKKKNIEIFKKKNKVNNILNYQKGDLIIGEYLSIDRDGMHQYKFGGTCFSVLKKNNNCHILLRQKVSNVKIEFCINIMSPLIYMLKIIGKKQLSLSLKNF